MSRDVARSRSSSLNSKDENSSSKRQRHNHEERRNEDLACPFYKRDPYKYQYCLSYQLRRIKDVKQHVYRKHSKPEFYCARCFRTFPTASDRDLHTRPASCEMHTDPGYDGINEQQKKALATYVNRGKPLKQQWYDTYEIIFPGEAKPAGVFVGNYFKEAILLLRAQWNIRQSEIVSGLLESSSVSQQSINAIMNAVFDRVAESVDGYAAEQVSPLNTALAVPRVETPRIDRGNSNQGNNLDCTSLQSVSAGFLIGVNPASATSFLLI